MYSRLRDIGLFSNSLAFHYKYFTKLQKLFNLPMVCLMFMVQMLRSSVTKLVKN